jgi:hypothetical protein
VLGSKDRSRAVAKQAAVSTGLGAGIIELLLPYIIQMLMGGLAGKTSGGLGDILSKIPGMPGGPSAGRGAGQGGGGLGDILSKIPGMPGGPPAPRQQQQQDNPRWPSMPTSNPAPDQSPWPPMQHEPTPVPPVPSGGGFGGSPLPLPGDVPRGGYGGGGYNQPQAPQPQPRQGDNPFGDLSDIIRGGKGIPGGAGGAAIGGGMLWTLIRSMLGGALGFSGKGGIMSWLFRMVFMRYGWSIVKTIFSRVLLRR